jgi:site-specific DNA-methyltransferase (cytosine-N4-specific)
VVVTLRQKYKQKVMGIPSTNNQEQYSNYSSLEDISPYYKTELGKAYLGDARKLLKLIPDNSVSLVIISPPYALLRKKSYGNPDNEKYVEWFRPFAQEVFRILKNDGSFVIEIGGSWKEGHPVRSIYHYELLLDLVKRLNFNLAQEFFWFNSAKMPGPAQWVNIERVRCTDAVNTIWWLSKTERPKANNRNVLQPYSDSMKELLKNGYNKGPRPSGHVVSNKWQKDLGGSIPKNLLEISNTSSHDPYQRFCRENGIQPHPARFPWDLPKFFIRFLTDNENDVVLDFFAGSNVTGAVCEELRRPWIAFELQQNFLEGSKCRFGLPVDLTLTDSKNTKNISNNMY